MEARIKFLLILLAFTSFYVLVYSYLPLWNNILMYRPAKQHGLLLMSSPTQPLSRVKQNSSTKQSIQEKSTHILQALYSHIDQRVANLTRNQLKRFNPINTLRVYPDGESVANRNYTETTQANGEPWIKAVNTCAVLGNSGILSGSKCGQEIDAHDHVFRSNMAHVADFTEDVGAKTSLVTINSEGGRWYGSCSQNENDTCYKNVHQYMKNLDNSTIVWVTKSSARYPKMGTVNALRKIKPNIIVARPKSLINRMVGRRWNIRKPSSGLYLFSLAGTLCNKISLYGFYPFNETAEGKPVNYHYYENVSFVNGHDMPEEYKLLQRLNASRAIRLVTSPCSSFG